MKTVHVVLVSDQPIPNLTTLLQFRPDLALLLYTSDMGAQKDRLQTALKAKQISVEFREILPYDLNNVIGVCEKILSDYRESDISLNITCGTKIGTMGVFQVFYSGDKPIYYVNTRDNQIMKVALKSENIPIDARIGMKEYLASYGFKMTGYIAAGLSAPFLFWRAGRKGNKHGNTKKVVRKKSEDAGCSPHAVG